MSCNLIAEIYCDLLILLILACFNELRLRFKNIKIDIIEHRSASPF